MPVGTLVYQYVMRGEKLPGRDLVYKYTMGENLIIVRIPFTKNVLSSLTNYLDDIPK